MKHLWLHNGVYPDWIAEDVFTLRCCEMFHCTPSQLAKEDWHIISRLRTIKAAEDKYLDADRKARAKGRNRGR